MTAWQMYWLTRLDGIKALMGFSGGILLILGGTAALFWKGGFPGVTNRSGYWPFVVPVFGAFLIVLSVFTPTTKEMAAILIVPKIVNNAKVQELPDKVLTLATEWLEDLRPANLPAKESK